MRDRRGFCLRELGVLTTASVIGLALLAPLAVHAGGQSRMSICMSRLKSISMSTARYGLDHQDRLAALQGRPGQRVTYPNPGLNITVNYSNSTNGDFSSVADQAIDIIRRRGNRNDISRFDFVASQNFSHLALVEYDQEPLPSARWACPEDATLLTWQSNPLNFNNLGVPAPVNPGILSNSDKRWPYISSYQRGTHVWSANRATAGTQAWFYANATQLQSSGGFTTDRSAYGQRRLSEVAFPSAKVYMWDRGSRHFTPTAVFWNFAQTKQPMLFFDGATRTIRTGATDRGWDWLQPNNRGASWSYTYSISTRNEEWQPGFPSGNPRGTATMNAAHFATTREGLAGRDLPSTGPQ